MASLSVSMGIFAAVTAGSTPIDRPDTTMPLVLVAETTQSDTGTAPRTIKSGGSDKAFTVKSQMQDHNDAICPHWYTIDRRVDFVITQVN